MKGCNKILKKRKVVKVVDSKYNSDSLLIYIIILFIGLIYSTQLGQFLSIKENYLITVLLIMLLIVIASRKNIKILKYK